MSDNRHFDRLMAAGKPVGEIVGIDRFMVRIRGLQPVNIHALILFEDGSKGYVHQILETYVEVLHLGTLNLRVGMVAIVQHEKLVTKVGKDFIGRVISVTGEPLDGKGPIAAEGVWPVFNEAPLLYEREQLDLALETGITILDTLFPLMRGQRIAILGDGKSGKSTLAAQLAINQKNTNIVTVYALIAKRRSDVDMLLTRLLANDTMKNTIVVVSTMSDSLIQSYLAPYVACSLAEYFWQQLNQDALIIYDDLTAHAHAYREIALLSGMSPGRDSYPGDMFYQHSSLLERAGKLNRNHKTLTSIPMVFASSGDITAYLPTNVMSITDGQWILDMNIFRDTMRPAVSAGLSVSRVGGRGQTARQKKLAGQVFKSLTAHAQAQEFARFGSELSGEAKQDLRRGELLYKMMTQSPGEVYTFMEQTLMLDIIFSLTPEEDLDLVTLKANVKASAVKITEDDQYESVRDDLKRLCITTRPSEDAAKKDQAKADTADEDKKPAKEKEAKA
jgi:F-type H+/Na+-transporting ATPase subunit alpha